MSSFLDKIRNSVEERVKNIKLSNRVDKNNLNFLDIFTEKKQTIICEIKFSSPSRGKIYYGKLNHIEIAGQYLEQGASALSVLAEPHYFNGNVNYIKDIREKFPKAHILLKDFVLDERQIQQALQVGANAILLMASFLTHDRLSNLYKYATNLGITPLLEVHNEVELMQVLKLKPKLIGINNRNLKNLTINLNTSRSLIKNIPKNIFTICESGIENFSQIQEMSIHGFNGFLIGTNFMCEENPGIAFRVMLSEKQK